MPPIAGGPMAGGPMPPMAGGPMPPTGGHMPPMPPTPGRFGADTGSLSRQVSGGGSYPSSCPSTLPLLLPTHYPSYCPPPQLGGLSVTQNGFQKMWGQETVDLLQNRSGSLPPPTPHTASSPSYPNSSPRHILPSEEVTPPKPRLQAEQWNSANCRCQAISYAILFYLYFYSYFCSLLLILLLLLAPTPLLQPRHIPEHSHPDSRDRGSPQEGQAASGGSYTPI